MNTPPPTPESPCKKKIHPWFKRDCLNGVDVKGRRSLQEIFELVIYRDGPKFIPWTTLPDCEDEI